MGKKLLSKEELISKIIKESNFIGKIRDKSFLDEDFPEAKEIIKIISDYQNKKDLAKKFIETIPLYFDKSGLWWRWVEYQKRWELTDDIDILNLLYSCSKGINIINSKERGEIINALKQESRKCIPKKPENTWIQFNKEIVDIETGERFEATPEYFFANPIPHNLGRTSDTPVMDKIFKEWVGEKYIKTLYQIIAYCLLADYPIHRLFCFIGSGMNGKSCFLNLLRKFIGDNNVCSTELDILLNSRFEITRLHKKLVCQMGETNFNEMSKTSFLKKLTGGDLIGFEYKNKNHFEEVNYAKIIIATNSLPTTTDKTLGFYRRWLIIDFPNQFSEKNDILKDVPKEEYENLAMKCIEILYDLLNNRSFENEGSVEERLKKFEEKSDFLQKFLDDFVSEDVNEYISKSNFYKKFIEWCVENRHRKLAENTLGKKMKEKGIEAGKKYVSWLYDGKGGQMKVWLGINWKN